MINSPFGRLYDRKEAAGVLGVSVAALDEARRSGRLAFVQHKNGGKIWVPESAIKEYLESGLHPALPKTRIIARQTYRKRRVI